VREALREHRLPHEAADWLEEQAMATAKGLFTVAFVGTLASGRLPMC
jgi:hypothetical protein